MDVWITLFRAYGHYWITFYVKNIPIVGNKVESKFGDKMPLLSKDIPDIEVSIQNMAKKGCRGQQLPV